MAGFGAIASRVYALFTRTPSTASMIVDLARPAPEDRVLEIGCGAGGAVELAAERVGADRVSAVDPSATFVDMVTRRVPGATIRCAGAEDLPFDDDAFTVVLSVASMHHWDDRAAGLRSVARVLGPGGRLLIAERAVSRPGHGITPGEVSVVEQELRDVGFEAVRTTRERAGHRTMAVIRAALPAASRAR